MADGKVIIDIEADGSDFKEEISGLDDEAKKGADGLNDLGDGARNAGEGMDAANVAMGTFIADGVTALISAVGDAIGSLVGLADATREYREDMAKLNTAFSVNGFNAEQAASIYEDFYAVLGESDRSVEAVNHLAGFANNMQELNKWGVIATGVTARFGDSLPIEGLTEAANETAKVGKVTGPLADALNWAGISEEEFNKQLEACNSEQERATLITNTLNEEYKAAAEEYDELTRSAQDARYATLDMENAQAALGAAIEPVTTAWTNLKVNALEAITPAIEFVSQKILDLNKWMEENPEKAEYLKGALVGVAAAVAVLVVAFGGLMIVNTLKTAFAGLAAAMGSAFLPVTLIIAGIALLVAGFMYLWNNCEGFREFWLNLWENIKTIAAAVAEWFSTTWDAVIAWLKTAWDSIKGFFSDLWESVKETATTAWEGIKSVFQGAWDGIKAIWAIVVSFFSGIWDGISNVFSVVKAVLSGFFSDAWEAIKYVVNTWSGYFSAVWTLIKGVFSAVGSWFKEKFQAAKDGIAEIWDTITDYFSGVWENIKGVFTDAVDAGKKIVEDLKQGISDAWDGLVTWFNGIWDRLFSRSAKVTVNEDGNIDAHPQRNGIAYVPYDGYYAMLHKGERVLTASENAAYRNMMAAAVSSETGNITKSVPYTGYSELAQAVGMQTAGINSLSAEYRRGGANKRPIILTLDKRELGRAIVDTGSVEESRRGTKIVMGGAYA